MIASRSQVLKYALLPGFIPRIVTLFSSGFGYTAYLIAVIYQSLRLLPPNHPYLNPANFGRYGIRHVIAEAANNLVISKKNIDQVVVFFTILIGMVLLVAQFGLLIVAFVAHQPSFAGLLIPARDVLNVISVYNQGPEQDLAFIILDRVFGMKNIFDSCISTGVPCNDLQGNQVINPGTYPFPFHIALHTMLRFYSLGIFVVSVFVILYYVITITAETAATGTPFGQRYNKAWVPLRLIAFFALLVPLNIGQTNAGLNGAQLITLWTAKFGSNFASNAWGRFNQTLTNTYLGQVDTLVATPNIPSIGPLIQFMFVAKTCKIAEEWAYEQIHTDLSDNRPDGIQAYVIRERQQNPAFPQGTAERDASDLLLTGFTQALQFSNYGNIHIRFGALDPDSYKDHRGAVFPYCGDITVPIATADQLKSPGAYAIQQYYYQLIQRLWNDQRITDYAACIVKRTYQKAEVPDCNPWRDQNFAKALLDAYEFDLKNTMPGLIQQQWNSTEWDVTPEMERKGWAGAAIWYNRVAALNGAVTTAVLALPQATKYPYVMETIATQRRMDNEDVNPSNIYDTILSSGEEINYPRHADQEIVPAIINAYEFWETDTLYQSHFAKTTGHGIVIDTINFLFGTSGIFDMRANVGIHPLAQLSSLGKAMMEASIRNLAVGVGGGFISKFLPDFVGEIGNSASSFLRTIGMATMTMSFILYYVLPFLPFIYFVFAVSGWVKSIFEAIVAMPLWALAHIRIDGEGLPGPAATNGYFLLLEIFIRPILILIGLLASINIFSSLVIVLNDVFELVVANVGGFDVEGEVTGTMVSKIDFLRGPVDEFFFTAMYVIICYMMALACFKLINQIPDNILRWAGISVSTFQEGAGDPAGEITGKIYTGGTLASGQIRGGALAALISR